jgi:sugar phosphate isomerase/epimerase
MYLKLFGLIALMTMSLAYAADRNDIAAEQLGFKLSLQAWTCHHTTLWETIDVVQSVGLKYLELYPGQTIGGGIEGKFDHNSPVEVRAKVLARFTEAGITPVAYGVVGLSAKEADSRKVFEFAKAMGISVIVSEPPPDAFDTIEKLIKEYDIKVGIHEHKKPNRYWDPAFVVAAVKDRDPRFGACADTGHWARSALVPVDCLKVLEGRIMSSHLKETDKIGDGARDVIYGTGASDVKGQLAEFKRQGFRGYMALEYEAGKKGQELLNDLKVMIAYFDTVTTEMVK